MQYAVALKWRSEGDSQEWGLCFTASVPGLDSGHQAWQRADWLSHLTAPALQRADWVSHLTAPALSYFCPQVEGERNGL